MRDEVIERLIETVQVFGKSAIPIELKQNYSGRWFLKFGSEKSFEPISDEQYEKLHEALSKK